MDTREFRQDVLIRQLQGGWRRGTGSPEGAVDASPGTVYASDDGSLYLKETGTGSTGWVEITTSEAFAFFTS